MLKCSAGTKKDYTCITVRNKEMSDDQIKYFKPVRILNNNLGVGHRQIGILLINVPKANVEGNFLIVNRKPRSFTFPRLMQDKTLRSMARKWLISDAHFGQPKELTSRKYERIEYRGYHVNFKTEKRLVDKWKKILEIDPPKATIESDSDLLKYFNNMADKIILKEGRIGRLRIFKDWYNDLAVQNPAVGEQGIVVGGRKVDNIKIRNNTIDGFLQGIRIGVSHKETSRGIPDIAKTIHILDNNIMVLLSPISIHERYGIFVGNCNSLMIENNYIEVKRFKKTLKLAIEGIRVYGYFGKRMIIHANHLENFNIGPGISINPLNFKDFNNPVWAARENVAMVVIPQGPEDPAETSIKRGKVTLSQNYA
jgi:hypothetical protein